MPTSAKPKKSTNSGSNARKSAAKKTTGSARKTPSAKKAPASSRARSVGHKVEGTVGSIGTKVDAIVDKTRGAAGTVAKGTAAAAVGTAVAAVAGRALISSRQPKRVLGVRMPRRRTGMKAIAKRVSDIAGQVEKSSLDVSKASSQAKQAANILS